MRPPTSALPSRIAVVTPVLNGADVIAGCVRSVRAQDHADWVHLVVDNGSTDGLARAVATAADGDPRVVLVRHGDTLPMLGSWNRAMTHAPADAGWVKHLSADDRMVPHCLSALRAAALASPHTTVVGSRWREGQVVAPAADRTVAPVMGGRRAMREYLLGGPDVFGTPSSLLFRRDALPAGDIYDAEPWPPGHPAGVPGPNTDKTGIAPMLLRGDFAFVDEVLTHDEPRPGSQSDYAARMRIQVPGNLDMILQLGPTFLTRAEQARRLQTLSARYARSLGKAFALGRPLREPEFALMHLHVVRHLHAAMRRAGFHEAPAVLAPFLPMLAAARRHHGGRRRTAA